MSKYVCSSPTKTYKEKNPYNHIFQIRQLGHQNHIVVSSSKPASSFLQRLCLGVVSYTLRNEQLPKKTCHFAPSLKKSWSSNFFGGCFRSKFPQTPRFALSCCFMTPMVSVIKSHGILSKARSIGTRLPDCRNLLASLVAFSRLNIQSGGLIFPKSVEVKISQKKGV